MYEYLSLDKTHWIVTVNLSELFLNRMHLIIHLLFHIQICLISNSIRSEYFLGKKDVLHQPKTNVLSHVDVIHRKTEYQSLHLEIDYWEFIDEMICAFNSPMNDFRLRCVKRRKLLIRIVTFFFDRRY